MRIRVLGRAMAAVMMSLGLAACGGGGSDNSTGDPRGDGGSGVGGGNTTLTSVGIAPRVAGTNPGVVFVDSAGVQLEALADFVTDAGTENRGVVVTNTVNWSVSDPSIATVTNTGRGRGLVRGVSVGTTEVRVEAQDTRNGSIRSATLPIQVRPNEVLRLVVNGTGPAAPGATSTYSAFAELSDGSSRPVSVQWTTTTPDRIRVSPTSGMNTTVTAVGTGPGTVVASAEVGGRQFTTPTAFTVGNGDPTTPPTGGDGRDERETPEIIAECGELGPPTTRFLVTSVRVCQNDRTLVLGSGPKTYVATVNYTDLTAGRPDVTWLIDDPSIVEITPMFGNYVALTPKKVGSTLIRVQTPREAGSGQIVSSSTSVTVVSPEQPDPDPQARVVGVVITPDDTTLPVGQSRTFSAFAVLSNGAMRIAENGTTAWTVGDLNVATLDADRQVSTRATLRTVGTTTLNVTLTSGQQTFNDTITLTATEPKQLTGVRIAPNAIEPIQVDSTAVLTVQGEFNDGTTGDVELPVSWSTSNAAIGTVTPSTAKVVNVRGVAPGNMTVTVRATDTDGTVYRSTLPVTVKARAVLTGITILPSTLEPIPVGEARTLSVVGRFSDGTSGPVSGIVDWTSSATAILSATSPGLSTTLQARAIGQARISARTTNSQGTVLTAQTGDLSVIAAQPQVNGIRITPDTANLALGRSADFGVELTFTDGSTRALDAPAQWTTETPAVLSLTTNPRSVTVKGTQVGTGRFMATVVQAGRTFTATRVLAIGNPELVSVNIQAASTQVISGTQASFQLMGVYSDSPLERLVTDRPVTWSKGAAEMRYTLGGGTGPSQSVTGNEPESASIRATVAGVGEESLTDLQAFTVVADRLVALVSVGPKDGFNTTIPLGQTFPFEVIGRFLSGATRPVDVETIAFSPIRGQGRNVEVDTSGGVTGVAQGQDTVEATYVGAETVSPSVVTVPVTVVEAACVDAFTTQDGAQVSAAPTGLCIGCTVTSPDLILDGITSTFATLNVPVAAINGGVNIQVTDRTRVVTPGRVAGFLLSAPSAALLSAEIQEQITVVTTRNGVETIDRVGTSVGAPPLRLTLLGTVGGRDLFSVGVPTTMDYDGVRLGYSAALSALSSVRVHSACAAQIP